MGVAIYPRIQGVSESWVYEISGKALAAQRERLHKMVKGQGLKDLLEYFVPSKEDAEEVGAEVEEKWFQPDEGIEIIDAMTAAVDTHPAGIDRIENVKADLQAFRSILERAKAEGRMWNLSMDY
jgi:hypothetical protein